MKKSNKREDDSDDDEDISGSFIAKQVKRENDNKEESVLKKIKQEYDV